MFVSALMNIISKVFFRRIPLFLQPEPPFPAPPLTPIPYLPLSPPPPSIPLGSIGGGVFTSGQWLLIKN